MRGDEQQIGWMKERWEERRSDPEERKGGGGGGKWNGRGWGGGGYRKIKIN